MPAVRPGRLPAAIALCLLLLAATTAPAAEGPALAVERWLVLGPFATPLPALADDDTLAPIGAAELLAQPPVVPDRLWPRAGQTVALPDGTAATWRETQAAAGRLELRGAPAAYNWAVLAAYVSTGTFTGARLSLASTQPFTAWLDGEKVAGRATADSAGTAVTAEVKLASGKHALVIVTLAGPAAPAWTVTAQLTPSRAEAALAADCSPRHAVRIEDYLDNPAISGLELSAGGDLVAVTMRRPEVPAPDSETWVEIRRAGDGAPVRTIRGDHAGSFTWGATGRRFSYVTVRDGRSTLWLDDLDGGPARALLRDVEDFGGHRWLPGGKAIVYTLGGPKAKDPAGVRRLRGLTDRWPGTRSVGSLHLVTVADGMTRRLTAGRWTCDVQDAAADGRRLLVTRTLRDDARFPFNEEELYELDTVTLAATKLLAMPRGVTARYGPREGHLVLKASPSAFGGVGRDLPDDRVPNDFDDQLFTFERATGAVTPITRDFDPSIEAFAWSVRAGRLFATATDTTAVGIYVWDPVRPAWRPLPAQVEAVGALALSADGSRLAWHGEDALRPERVFTLDLTRKGARPVEFAAPAGEALADVEFGRHETWDFATRDGTRIPGDVYYPPGFTTDGDRKWPCIVFYYGGTSPVSREFGGRYPKSLWAAHGYVVYVLQPSGATGFGQEFSSRHVNTWGIGSADEIIEGTRKFLDAHPFVDPDRVGCIGASYGGFMTMLVLTKTDLFAAAVSHAGISALSSYWGEGWWGVDYSTVATAGSYPWNRPDLYVEQSPLFHADRITTPLLLLHGDGDTNVPVGESDQMYAALRVLGKEVEYVKVDGQNHWIVNYPQRVLWMRTIIAWFDRTLKDDPAWWDHLYGDEGTAR
jgi:dipeptidyl aminopeptidase/acylaminoacyl peptidase